MKKLLKILEQTDKKITALKAGFFTTFKKLQNTKFPQLTLPRISLPKLPKLPTINLPKLNIPKIGLPHFVLPKFKQPRLSELPIMKLSHLTLPKITIPSLSFPIFDLPRIKVRFPSFKLPKINLPKLPKLPKFTMPTIKIPEVKFPKFDIPTIKLPSIQLPKLPKVNMPTIRLPRFNIPQIKLPSFQLPTIKLPNFKLPKSKPITSNSNKYIYSISEAAKFLGVNADTLRNWEEKGRISPARTKGGSRRFYLTDLKKVLTDRNPLLAKNISNLFNPPRKRFALNYLSIFLISVLIFWLGAALLAFRVQKVKSLSSTHPYLAGQRTNINQSESNAEVLAAEANPSPISQFINFIFSPLRIISDTIIKQTTIVKKIKDVNDILTLDEQGNLVPKIPIKLPEITYLKVAPEKPNEQPQLITERIVTKELIQQIASAPAVIQKIFAEAGGIKDIKSDSARLTVSTTDDISTLALDLGGITADVSKDSVTNEDIKDGAVTNSKLSQITDSNKVAGSAIQLASGGGLADSSGLTLLRTCSSNQVLAWNGSSWACADQSGSGSDTDTLATVTARGATTTTAVTLGTVTTTGNVGVGASLTVTSAPVFSLLGSGIVFSNSSGGLSSGVLNLAGSNVGGILSLSNGGTGASDSQTAINNISQLSVTGDLLYYDGTNSTRFARGASGQCLTTSGGTLSWGACGTGGGSSAVADGTGGWFDNSSTITELNSAENVGIGTSVSIALAKLEVQGTGNVSALNLYTVSKNGGVQGLTVTDGGYVGIGVTNPAGVRFSVFGSVGIGNSGTGGFAVSAAPSNGLAIQGNLGIGTTTANNALTIIGGASIGNNYNFAAPTNGLIVQGNVGIGISAPSQQLQVNSGTSSVVVTSGGNVGIGITTPLFPLHVLGNVGIGTSLTVTSLINTTGLNVTGTSSLGTAYAGTLTVSGNTGVGGSLTTTGLDFASGGLRVNGFSDLTGNVGIGSSLIVASGVNLQSSLRVLGNTNLSTLETSGNITNAGVFLASDGTAGAPGYSFSADSDTGIFRPGPNALGFTTNATSRLSITAGGNVGIGFTQPATTLGVAGNVNIGYTGAISDPLGLAVRGNVGIGITTPLFPLHVLGNVGIGTSLTVTNLANLGGLNVSGTSSLGTAYAGGLTVSGNTGVGGSLTTTGLDYATGGLRVNGYSDLTGNVGIGSSLTTTGLEFAQGGLRVNGFSNLTGNVGVGLSLNVNSASILDSLSVTKSISTATLGTSGNVGIGGSLNVGSAAVFSSLGIGVVQSNNLGGISSGVLNLAGSNVGGILGIANGGTNASTSQGAINNISQLTTNGDLLYYDGTNSTKLARGNNGQCLTSTGSTISWGSCGSGGGSSAVADGTGGWYDNGTTITELTSTENVGIGTSVSVALAKLEVQGTGNVSALNLYTVSNNGAVTGLAVTDGGYVGIGTTSSVGAARLSVFGSVNIGNTGSGGFAVSAAPPGGLAVQGNLGIGTTSPLTALQVWGDNVNSAFLLNGNVGIGTTSPKGLLQIAGNVGIGWTGPAGPIALPGLGLSVFGNVGIGTTTPTSALQVVGNVGIGASLTVTSLTNTSGLNVTNTSSLGTAYAGTLTVSGNTGIGGSLTTTGLEFASGGLRVNSYSDLTGNVGIGGSLNISSAAVFSSLGIGVVQSNNLGGISSGVLNLASSNFVSGTLGISNGGTGATTSQGAINGISQLTTTGDLLYYDGTNSTRFARGAAGQCLTTSGGTLSWGSCGTGGGGAAADGTGGWYDSGSNITQLDSSENVGIGTSTSIALAKLEVQGNGNVSGLNLYTVSKNGSVTGLAVTDGGYVGIGTTSSVGAARLSVFGSVNIGNTGAGGFAISAAPSNGLAVEGNVGIGTTSPSSALQVIGNVGIGSSLTTSGLGFASGGLRVNGFSDLTGNVGIGGSINISATSNFRLSGQTNCVNLNNGGKLTTDASGNVFCSDDLGGGGSGSSALSAITAATAANPINNGDFAQTWNFSLTTADKAGFTFGENSASTATGYPAILSASTLSGSTAIPLYITNLGNGLSFRIDDVSSDTSPFVVDASGNVGIGFTTPLTTLAVSGNLGIGPTASRSRLSAGTYIGTDGNVGIGTTTANNALTVIGGTTIGGAYNFTAPTNGLIVQGNVGIGTSAPSQQFQVNGNSNSVVITSAGNVGIGITTPLFPLHVLGNVGIGTSLTVTSLINTTGLNVSGTSSLGTGYAGTLTVSGNTGVGGSLTTTGLDFASGGLRVNGFADLTGNVGIGSSLTVASGVNLQSSLRVLGNTNLSTLETSGNITNAGVFLASDGTAGAPGYSFSADSDTGIFRPGLNALGLSTNATSRLSITAGGNVGIGFTQPATTLGVAGNVNIGYTGAISDSLGLAVRGNVGIGTTTTANGLQIIGSEVIGFSPSSIGPVSGLALSGNIGIGTTSPTAQLYITSTTSPTTDLAIITNIGMAATADGINGLQLTFDSAAASGAQNGPLRVQVNNKNTGAAGQANGIRIVATGPGGSVNSDTNGLTIDGLISPSSGTSTEIAIEVGASWDSVLMAAARTVITGTGNIGIGTTTPGSVNLGVIGNVGIGYSVMTGTFDLGVRGNVGIGTSSPRTALDIFGDSKNSAFFLNGNVGIGTTIPGASLTVAGNVNIGWTGLTPISAPSSGLSVNGNVGIGTTTTIGQLTIAALTSLTQDQVTISNLGQPINTTGISNLQLNYVGGSATNIESSGERIDITAGTGSGSTWNGLRVVLGNSGSGTGVIENGIKLQGPSVTGVQTENAIYIDSAWDNALVTQPGAGNVGIGTTAPRQALQVIGQINIDNNSNSTNEGCIQYNGSLNELTYSNDCITYVRFQNIGVGSSVGGGWVDSGRYVSLINNTDNVGIGTSVTGNIKLGVIGNVGIGYTGTMSESFGLSVKGNVGIGTTTASSSLVVVGNENLGTTYAGVTAPANGLLVQGNVGIGTTGLGGNGAFNLDVWGTGRFTGLLTADGNVNIGGSLVLPDNKGSLPTQTGAVNGQFWIGSSNALSGTPLNAAGRIWIRSNGTLFRFASSSNIADYSEFIAQSEPSEAGDVMVVDEANSSTVKKSSHAYEQNILGVITEHGTGYNNDDCPADATEEEKLSGSCGNRIGNPNWANVGMLGQIDVKVSTENGPIKIGDRLTTSSTSGVAMKVTKATQIIGRALEAYDNIDPTIVGKVKVLVSPAYFDPDTDSVDDLDKLELEAQNIASYSAQIPFAKAGQAKSGSNFGQYSIQGIISGAIKTLGKFQTVVVGNLKSGAVVSDEISADTLFANSGAFSILEAQKVIVDELIASGLSIIGEDGLAKIKLDSSGNAYFAGKLTADKIKANSIEGLEVWTDKIGSLSEKLAQLEASQSAQQATNSATIADNTLGATPSALLGSNTELKSIQVSSSLANLNVEGLATISGKLTADSLHVKNSALVEEVLNVVDTITSTRLIVAQWLEVLGKSVFRGDVYFAGRPSFNSDTTGVAIVKSGEAETSVVFEKEYEKVPMVNVSINLDAPEASSSAQQTDLENTILNGDIRYIVTRRSTKGFVIKLNKSAPVDLQFSWTALQVNNQISQSSPTPSPQASSP